MRLKLRAIRFVFTFKLCAQKARPSTFYDFASRQRLKTLQTRNKRLHLRPGNTPRKSVLYFTNVRSLGKSHLPATIPKKAASSSTLAYKFIRKLSQFKCPRCFNQGASLFPSTYQPPFRAYKQPPGLAFLPLDFHRFTLPPTTPPHSPNRDINSAGFSCQRVKY